MIKIPGAELVQLLSSRAIPTIYAITIFYNAAKNKHSFEHDIRSFKSQLR